MATIYKNRHLVYLSIILFFFFSGIGCLTPFLTVHMRHLGFALPEVAIINTVAAFVSILGPVLGGVLAERYQKYKIVTVTCLLLASLAYVALTFIPRTEKLHYRPLVDFSCKSGVRIERCANWATCKDALPADNLTTVQLTNCHYQCPGGDHQNTSYPLHICFHGNSGNICVVYDSDAENNSRAEFQSQLSSWTYDELSEVNLLEDNNVTDEAMPRAHVAMCSYHPKGPIAFSEKQYHSISCRPLLEQCSIHCSATFFAGRYPVLPRLCEEATGNPSATFWSYLILRVIADACILTALCLLDAITVSSTNDYEGAYGRIHIWPAMGLAVFPPFSGALLDHYTDLEGRADFSPAAFLAIGLAALTSALIIAVPLHSRRNIKQFESLVNPSHESKFLSLEMVALLTIVLVLGTQWGVLCTFLPWLAIDIGCSATVIGLACTLAFGCSLPFLLISKNMVRNIGRANLLVFALLFYGTRYAGVSFVTSPSWTLPFAAMETFSLCVMWVAAVAYGQSLAPRGYALITQYTLNLFHFAVGRGFGSLLGGGLITHHGPRITFRGIAIWSAVVALLYLALYHLVMKRRRSSAKSPFPVLLNGTWYPLAERHPNGDAKAHQPIVVDQDDTESTVSSATDAK